MWARFAVKANHAFIQVSCVLRLAARDLAREQPVEAVRLDLRRDVALVAPAWIRVASVDVELVQQVPVIAAPCHDAGRRLMRPEEIGQHRECVRVLRNLRQVAGDDRIEVEIQDRSSEPEQFELRVPAGIPLG